MYLIGSARQQPCEAKPCSRQGFPAPDNPYRNQFHRRSRKKILRAADDAGCGKGRASPTGNAIPPPPAQKNAAGGSIEDRGSEMTGLGVGHLPGLKSPGVNTVFLLE